MKEFAFDAIQCVLGARARACVCVLRDLPSVGFGVLYFIIIIQSFTLFRFLPRAFQLIISSDQPYIYLHTHGTRRCAMHKIGCVS